MFATDDNGWKSFELTIGFSSLSGSTRDMICEMIRSIMNQKKLSKEDIELILYACYHSTIPISDEEIIQWLQWEEKNI